MVDATQQGWWGGVGCNSIVELAHMVDATQQMGWWGGAGCSSIVELEVGWGGVE